MYGIKKKGKEDIMRLNIFKRAVSAAVSAVMAVTAAGIMPLAVSAANDPISVTPTMDIGLRKNNTVSATAVTMEIRYNSEKDTDFVGALQFDMPEIPEGKVIKGAELKLVSERAKDGNNTFSVYPLDAADWTQEGTTYAKMETAIAEARASSPLIKNVLPKGENCAWQDAGAASTTIDTWVNNLSLDTEILLNSISNGKLAVLISMDNSSADTNNTAFFTKDAVINPNYKVQGVTDASQLYPTLTVTYGDPAVFSSSRINGADTISISPEDGTVEETYTVIPVDSDGNDMDVTGDSTIEASGTLPDGVSFNSETGVLSVNYSELQDLTTVTLQGSYTYDGNTYNCDKTVTITKQAAAAKSVEITPPADLVTEVKAGEAAQLGQFTAVVSYSDLSTDSNVTWSVSNTDNFEISSDGVLSLKASAAGEYSTDVIAAAVSDASVTDTENVSVKAMRDYGTKITGTATVFELAKDNTNRTTGNNVEFSLAPNSGFSYEINESRDVSAMMDEDEATSASFSQNESVIIDLGGDAEITRIDVSAESSTSIVGLAKADEVTLDENSVLLSARSNNWVRINNTSNYKIAEGYTRSTAKISDTEYTDSIEYTGSGTPEKYRYVIVDSNGSAALIKELTIWANLEPASVEISGDELINVSPSTVYPVEKEYTADIISTLGGEMDGDIVWSVSGAAPAGVSFSDGTLTITESVADEAEITIRTAVSGHEDIYAEKTIEIQRVDDPYPDKITISGEDSASVYRGDLGDTPTPAMTLTAEVLDQYGDEMTPEIEWLIDSDDLTVEDGVVGVKRSAVGTVSATVTARAASTGPNAENGYITATKNISITITDVHPTFDGGTGAEDDPLYKFVTNTRQFRWRTNGAAEAGPNNGDSTTNITMDYGNGIATLISLDISALDNISEREEMKELSLQITRRTSSPGSEQADLYLVDYEDLGGVDFTGDLSDEDFETIKTAATNAVGVAPAGYTSDSTPNEVLSTATNSNNIYTFPLTDKADDLKAAADENGQVYILLVSHNLASTTSTRFVPNGSDNGNDRPQLRIVTNSLVRVDASASNANVPIPLEGTGAVYSVALSGEYVNTGKDSNGESYDKSVSWSIESGAQEGVELTNITENGAELSVSETASEGEVVVRAKANGDEGVYSDVTVTLERYGTYLTNGSFENEDDDMMPVGWEAYDPGIEEGYDGVQREMLIQEEESFVANFNFSKGSNDNTEDKITSRHNEVDPLGNKGVYFNGVNIENGYEGREYTNNSYNSNGGPHIRVTSGKSYWASLDYYMVNLSQTSTADTMGPYYGYEEYNGSQNVNSTGTFYIKDHGTSTDYGTARNLINITNNKDTSRLRMNYGYSAANGELYMRNFRIAPQGIDLTQDAVDGENTLKVVDNMYWQTQRIAVEPGEECSYKFSAMAGSSPEARMQVIFYSASGEEVSNEPIDTVSGTSSSWETVSGEMTAPSGAAYAVVRLDNRTSEGTVWFDNVIFTKYVEDRVPTYIRITSAADTAIIPTSSTANRYSFAAAVYDQYNDVMNGEIIWQLTDEAGNAAAYEGIELRTNGVMTVGSSAAEGVVYVSASLPNGMATAMAAVNIAKYSEPETVTLLNGSLTEASADNASYPAHWTNSGIEVSVANGTFESGTSGWKLDNTSYDGSPDSVRGYTNERNHTAMLEPGNTGGSAFISNTGQSQGQIRSDDNNRVQIKGGYPYRLSAYFLAEGISSKSTVFLNAIQYNLSGNTINDISVDQFAPSSDEGLYTSDGWEVLANVFTASPMASRLRIDLRYHGGATTEEAGTVYFDDVRVEKLTGFDTTVKYNGDPTLKLVGYNEDSDPARGYGERWLSDEITGVTPGAQYVYSVKAKTENAAGGAYMALIFYDEDGRELSTVRSDLMTGTNDFTAIEGYVTAPAGAASVRAALSLDGSGSAWFTDASFENKDAEVTPQSVRIIGKDTIAKGETAYYTVNVTDQYGYTVDTIDIPLSASNASAGMSFDAVNYSVTASDTASAGDSITLSAEYGGVSASKTVTVADESEDFTISGPSVVQASSTKSVTARYSVSGVDAKDVTWTAETVSGSKGYVTMAESTGVMTVAKAAPNLKVTVTASYRNGAIVRTYDVTVAKAVTETSPGNVSGAGGGGGTGGSGEGGTGGSRPMGGVNGGGSLTSTDPSATPSPEDGTLAQPDPDYFTGDDNNPFTDINGVQWAKEAIVNLYKAGVVNGKTETEFCPDDLITRAEFVKIAAGAFKLTGSGELPFTDVPEDSWYYESVAAAYTSGIITGQSADYFGAGSNITRQDIAVIAGRIAEVKGLTLSESAPKDFSDRNEISDYARDAVEAMSKAGIITGFDDGTFRPFENATRAQAAVILYRLAGENR